MTWTSPPVPGSPFVKSGRLEGLIDIRKLINVRDLAEVLSASAFAHCMEDDYHIRWNAGDSYGLLS